MIMTTEYNTVHQVFCETIMFELYDTVTKNKIYEFYDRFSDVKCYLPNRLNSDNSLCYFLKFYNDDDSINDKYVKVVFKDKNFSFITM